MCASKMYNVVYKLTQSHMILLHMCTCVCVCVCVLQHDVNVEEKGLPSLLRCTGQKMQETGLYLVGGSLVIQSQ